MSARGDRAKAYALLASWENVARIARRLSESSPGAMPDSETYALTQLRELGRALRALPADRPVELVIGEARFPTARERALGHTPFRQPDLPQAELPPGRLQLKLI